MLAVLFGGLLTGPEPLAGHAPPVHASVAADTRAPAADPGVARAATGKHTIASAAPAPDRGERPDAVVAGAPLVSWVHGLNSTLPDQAPTLGATVATAPLSGATRRVHSAHTDHHPSRAPPQV
ncbi:hypothetical protein [Actinopolymorpha rutila]|uniref:Uncharacterized protein n=1 Tax=Actinopolymorpha rutila TaxID=446787 RepID=A0A852ZND8_9ACTN|nr:hypothetical protein [Actinopolymorpha rutila]NYH90620.1 hypothetical protein [Actinopolymorpha rutila]